MPRIPFDRIPDSGRVWIFGSDRRLADDEEHRFLAAVDAFLDRWAAHGTPLTVGRDWRYGRFILVGLDESSVPPSGCSIDAMVNTLKDLEAELGATFVDNTPVWYRRDDDIGRVSRSEFKDLVRSGSVRLESVVFDNTVTRVGQVRSGEWERPAGEAWHGRAFFRDRAPA
jgi:hypothetical protein